MAIKIDQLFDQLSNQEIIVVHLLVPLVFINTK